MLADLRRLQGRVLLAQDRREEARCAFLEAIETAGRQGAGLYHLRCARDLARILSDDDRRQAIDVLAPAVEGVTEHREGLDYREAVELLRELRGGSACG
jgi:hypothetical protein